MSKIEWRWFCGHCDAGHHDRCPREIRNGVKAAHAVTRCSCEQCAAEEVQGGRQKALL